MKVVGLDKKKVESISKIKNEDSWVLDYRLKSYDLFNNLDMPSFGPKYDIDFDKIIYYKGNNKDIKNNWNDINTNVKNELNGLGVLESECHMDGIGVQYESEVIYHKMLDEIESKHVIFTSIENAMKELSKDTIIKVI